MLIEYNILQYACSEYTGIYEWNRVGGGECFPDVIAPSNRIQYLALCSLYGKDNPLCRHRLDKVRIS